MGMLAILGERQSGWLEQSESWRVIEDKIREIRGLDPMRPLTCCKDFVLFSE